MDVVPSISGPGGVYVHEFCSSWMIWKCHSGYKNAESLFELLFHSRINRNDLCMRGIEC